ncbi:MAG: class I SAM-dependent methyltransferase, partial [Parachlamydiaceae bacterium]|nr:class I SAM-dependent methyltransferase [Parachlamydiaceae bacterium]
MTYPISSISSAFNENGFKVSHLAQDIYQIENSHSLTINEANSIISKVGCRVLFSENRICGNLTFSFDLNKRFKKKLLAQNIELPSQTVWEAINSTQSLRESGKPITIQGYKLFNSPEEGEEIILKGCWKPAAFLTDFWDSIPSSAKVLDLGCGQGVNFLPLLSKGCEVTAVDRSQEMLTICTNTIDEKGMNKALVSLI